MPLTRLEAFSDGVFAIAITLLVLELKVPTQGTGLLHDLLESWREYFGYLISFAFIGGIWMAHSELTRFLKASNGTLLRLNLLLLLFVSFMPHTTSVMTEHTDDEGRHVAVVLFGLNVLLATLVMSLMIRYAAHHESLVDNQAAEHELRAFERERRAALSFQVVSVVTGIFLPDVAIVLYLVVALALIFDPRPWLRRRRHLAA
jgi:uncharacterized membrane protein